MASKRKGIRVAVDLGPVEASEDQIARMKAYISNQVITWAKVDLKIAHDVLVVCDEGTVPPGDGGDGDE